MADNVYATVDIPGVGEKQVLIVSEPANISDYGSLDDCFVILDNGKKALAVLSYISELATLKVGDVAGGNYFEVESDGTDVRHGDATMWDDIVGSLISRRLNSTAGKLDYDWNENAIKMQSGGDPANIADRLILNNQKPHSMLADGFFRLHIHWEQVNANKIEWRTQYRIQSNFVAKTTAWITVDRNSTDDSVGTYPGSGTFNQITKLAEIDMTGTSISATVQFRITRFDTTTGDILATFIDSHVPHNMIGSREEYVK